MKRHVKTLDSISGRLFLVGLLAGRLKNIPNFMLSSILNIISLSAYLVGYLIWYLTTFFYPGHQRKRESWYGFAQFKEQLQVAALLGLLATMFCLISPALIIPAAWIYTISNSFWSMGEYHKMTKPSPEDLSYSSVRQGLYLRYAFLGSASGIVTALAATVTFFYPAAALGIFIASTTISVSLMAVAAYYWGKCIFGVFTPDATIPIYASYGTIAQGLGGSLVQNNNEKIVAETPHVRSLFYPAVAENDSIDDALILAGGLTVTEQRR